jgi:ketosteroid isomerase-like protein
MQQHSSSSLVCALGLVVSATLSAQGSRKPSLNGSGDTQVQHAIMQAEDDWTNVLQHPNAPQSRAHIDKYIAPDFFAVDPDGIADRATSIKESLPDSTIAIVSNDDSARFVRVYGDAAVVTAIPRTVARDASSGQTTRYLGRYTETWIKRNGQWQVVAGAYMDAMPTKERRQQQLAAREQEYVAALNARDTAAYERYVSDSLVFLIDTTPGTRADVVKWMNGGLGSTKIIDRTERTYVTGDIGITEGSDTRTWKDGTTWRGRYTNTWRYNGGEWYLVARHLARIAESPSRLP